MTKENLRYIIKKGRYTNYIQSIKKDHEMNYSPSEVCEIFEIAKSTLYRWEQEGKISQAPRKLNGEREYSQSHIQEIAQIKLKLLSREYQKAIQTEDLERMRQLQKAVSQLKALYLDDIAGLKELAEYDTMPSNIIKELLIKASNLDPKDRVFREIIGLVNIRCNAF